MEEEKTKTQDANSTLGNIPPESKSIKEAQLKTEFFRMQFCVELFCDLVEFQKRSNQHLEETEKLIRDRRRKKRRSKWEVTNGAVYQKNH